MMMKKLNDTAAKVPLKFGDYAAWAIIWMVVGMILENTFAPTACKMWLGVA